MVDILEWIHQYVPMVEMMKEVHIPSLNKTVQVPTALSHPIELSGDQKTAARGRGAQKARVNSTLLSERLVGIIPVAADWHTKVKVLDVSSMHTPELHFHTALHNFVHISVINLLYCTFFIGDMEIFLLLPIVF